MATCNPVSLEPPKKSLFYKLDPFMELVGKKLENSILHPDSTRKVMLIASVRYFSVWERLVTLLVLQISWKQIETTTMKSLAGLKTTSIFTKM